MYKFHYKLQEQDNRDFKYKVSKVTTKTKYELIMPTIYDQLDLGSCVSNAVALVIYYFLKINPSRLYIYWNARAIAKYDMYQDTGLTVRDGCKSVHKFFVTPETNWLYITSNYNIIPPINAYQTAIKYTDMTYNSVNQTISDIKTCLTSNLPIIIGIAVYQSFLNPINGIVPEPNIYTEQLLGYHCVVIVGFDDSTKLFKLANSWGNRWGLKGYFYLSYNYITNPSLSSDFWCIKFSRLTKRTSLNNKKLLLLSKR
jgi:C1A family cysteine protease